MSKPASESKEVGTSPKPRRSFTTDIWIFASIFIAVILMSRYRYHDRFIEMYRGQVVYGLSLIHI